MMRAELLTRTRCPAWRSSQESECGLVCVGIVASYHGVDISLSSLRQMFPVSSAGMDLRTVMQCADRVGLAARPMTAELAYLRRVRLPAILHWNFNHFVVLVSINRRAAVIHDPSAGRVVLTLPQLENHFTGVVVELEPVRTIEPLHTAVERRRFGWREIWGQPAAVWRSLAAILAVSVVAQVALFASPLQLQMLIDAALPSGDHAFLLSVVVAFGFLGLFQVATAALRDWMQRRLSMQLSYQLVGELVRHLLRLPTRYFFRRQSADVLSRTQSAIAVQQIVTNVALSVVLDGMVGLAAAVFLFTLSPAIASVVVAGIFISVLIHLATLPAMEKAQRNRLAAAVASTAHLLESIKGIATIRMLDGEVLRTADWRERYAKELTFSFQFDSWGTLARSLTGAVSVIFLGVTIWVGGRAILEAGAFSTGALVATLAYRQLLVSACDSLLVQLSQTRMLRVHLDRLEDILAEHAVLPRPHAAVEDVRADIALLDVSFRYGVGDGFVFKDLSLHIREGEFVVITGPSGHGKTTLLKIILGLETPSSGDVLINGQRRTDGTHSIQESPRIGLVMQDDALFQGTVGENISFFDPSASKESLRSAALLAEVADDIARKPMGYLTHVGDMGSAFSAGQQQRILLARALYRRPGLLALDEGTANLDEATEREIAATISGLRMTRIAVAHRPAIIESADRVLWLENGILKTVRRRKLRETGANA